MDEIKEVKTKDLHNLKSSLTAVLGYMQLAEKKAESINSDESTKVVELIQKALKSAGSLEGQILKLEGKEKSNEPLMDI